MSKNVVVLDLSMELNTVLKKHKMLNLKDWNKSNIVINVLVHIILMLTAGILAVSKW